MHRLLFLCNGNYYRSRFAEIYFNWHAQQRGLPWQAESRGLALVFANPGFMSRHTLARLAQHGISVDAYQRLPQEVAPADFAAAQHIVAVKRTEHFPQIEARFPAYLSRVEFWEVHDLDCARPDDTIPHLEREVMSLVERLSISKNSPMK
jgi:protein-tyrosine phosphatase